MEDQQLKEMITENDENLMLGMMLYAAVGITIYAIGKKRGSKQTTEVLTSYVKGLTAGMNSKTED